MIVNLRAPPYTGVLSSASVDLLGRRVSVRVADAAVGRTRADFAKLRRFRPDPAVRRCRLNTSG